jgi:hypothetical protein
MVAGSVRCARLPAHLQRARADAGIGDVAGESRPMKVGESAPLTTGDADAAPESAAESCARYIFESDRLLDGGATAQRYDDGDDLSKVPPHLQATTCGAKRVESSSSEKQVAVTLACRSRVHWVTVGSAGVPEPVQFPFEELCVVHDAPCTVGGMHRNGNGARSAVV